MQRATKNKCSSTLLQAGSNIKCVSTPRTGRAATAGVGAATATTTRAGVGVGMKMSNAKNLDAGKKTQGTQRHNADVMRAAAVANVKQRQSAAEAAAKRHSTSGMAGDIGKQMAKSTTHGRNYAVKPGAGGGAGAASTTLSSSKPRAISLPSQEAKPKFGRSYDVYGKQTAKKQPPPSAAKKPTNAKPELGGIQRNAMSQSRNLKQVKDKAQSHKQEKDKDQSQSQEKDQDKRQAQDKDQIKKQIQEKCQGKSQAQDKDQGKNQIQAKDQGQSETHEKDQGQNKMQSQGQGQAPIRSQGQVPSKSQGHGQDQIQCQVLAKPRRAYNSFKRFFVPLLKRTTPRDFQQLRPAGQRYLQKLQRDQELEQERNKAEMRELVEATRTLLPQWLPLDELVPPPPQFADNDEDQNAWRYRIKRTDTVTLCNFPTLERQMLVREYAGHLQS